MKVNSIYLLFVTIFDCFLEFELVKQALYVDPYDQSAWIYHRWLIGDGKSAFRTSGTTLTLLIGEDEEILQREIAVIEELSEVEPDCKCNANDQPPPLASTHITLF